MRSVSSATWTRVLPVSWAFSPNLATISDLRSWVRVMRRASVAVSLREELPYGLDVGAHLADQVVDAGEATLAAQAPVELDAQRLVVEVAGEVEEVGLD